MGEMGMFENKRHVEIPAVDGDMRIGDGEAVLDDVELKGYDDVEVIDFKSEVKEEIIRQLIMLKYGKEVEIKELIPRDEARIDTIVEMAMRMREERENITVKDMAKVAVQEYLAGNNGSKSWILK